MTETQVLSDKQGDQITLEFVGLNNQSLAKFVEITEFEQEEMENEKKFEIKVDLNKVSTSDVGLYSFTLKASDRHVETRFPYMIELYDDSEPIVDNGDSGYVP